MSKHDFAPEEFAARRARVRAAMADAGLDWLVAIHPVSIHWLTGSDAKSYQEFQCLLIPAAPGPLTVITREGELNEFEDDALVDEVVGWGGGIVEDPVAVFAKHARRLGLLHEPGRHRGAGLLPAPASLRAAQGSSGKRARGRADEPDPRPQAGEVAGRVRLYPQGRADRRHRDGRCSPGRCAKARASWRWRARSTMPLLSSGSGLAASTLNLVSGERSGFSHGAPTARATPARRFRQHRVRLGLSALHIHHRPAVQHRRADAAHGRALRHRPPRRGRLHRRDSRRRAGGRAARGGAQGDRRGRPRDVPRSHDRLRPGARLPADLGRAAAHARRQPPTRCAPAWWSRSSRRCSSGRPERLGARIIDNVLVTEKGAELLSRFSRDLIVVE